MTKGTKHACHIIFGSDQVCLQSFLIGTGYSCHIFTIKNPFPEKHVHFWSNVIGLYGLPFYCASFLPIRFDRKWTCFAGNEFSILKILQSYLVLIRKDGRHTWFEPRMIWQVCLVPFFINMSRKPSSSLYERVYILSAFILRQQVMWHYVNSTFHASKGY